MSGPASPLSRRAGGAAALAALLALSSLAPGGLAAQTVWEGTSEVSQGGEVPEKGYFLATAAFPVNSVLTVLNLGNGRTLDAVVVNTLVTGSAGALLSKDAAAALGISAGQNRIRLSSQSASPAGSRFTDGRSFSGDPDYDPRAFVKENTLPYETAIDRTPPAPAPAQEISATVYNGEPPPISIIPEEAPAAPAPDLSYTAVPSVVPTPPVPSEPVVLVMTPPKDEKPAEPDLSKTAVPSVVPSPPAPSEPVVLTMAAPLEAPPAVQPNVSVIPEEPPTPSVVPTPPVASEPVVLTMAAPLEAPPAVQPSVSVISEEPPAPPPSVSDLVVPKVVPMVSEPVIVVIPHPEPERVEPQPPVTAVAIPTPTVTAEPVEEAAAAAAAVAAVAETFSTLEITESPSVPAQTAVIFAPDTPPPPQRDPLPDPPPPDLLEFAAPPGDPRPERLSLSLYAPQQDLADAIMGVPTPPEQEIGAAPEVRPGQFTSSRIPLPPAEATLTVIDTPSDARIQDILETVDALKPPEDGPYNPVLPDQDVVEIAEGSAPGRETSPALKDQPKAKDEVETVAETSAPPEEVPFDPAYPEPSDPVQIARTHEEAPPEEVPFEPVSPAAFDPAQTVSGKEAPEEELALVPDNPEDEDPAQVIAEEEAPEEELALVPDNPEDEDPAQTVPPPIPPEVAPSFTPVTPEPGDLAGLIRAPFAPPEDIAGFKPEQPEIADPAEASREPEVPPPDLVAGFRPEQPEIAEVAEASKPETPPEAPEAALTLALPTEEVVEWPDEPTLLDTEEPPAEVFAAEVAVAEAAAVPEESGADLAEYLQFTEPPTPDPAEETAKPEEREEGDDYLPFNEPAAPDQPEVPPAPPALPPELADLLFEEPLTDSQIALLPREVQDAYRLYLNIVPARDTPPEGGLSPLPSARNGSPALDQSAYYIHLTSAADQQALAKSAAQFDATYPVLVQSARGAYRLLLGPLNEGESNALLLRVRLMGFPNAVTLKP